MLAKLYVKLCDVYPKFRKATRKQMYQFMAGYYQKQDWTFMNYGYAPDDEVETPTLEADDEINRYCIQLYHHVANAINLKGLKVLEVGSGRGGGANYIKRYLNPAQMVGVDFSDKAVDLCREHYCVEGLSLRAEMKRIRRKDITPNVLEALDADHERRIAHIRRGAPKILDKLLQEFAGTKGAGIYKAFKDRAVVYQSFILQKA